jgi:TRAP-type C4-dicarboxylate transport system permease small subunit
MSIRKISDKISKFLMITAAVWAFILTFIIIVDIIGRDVFNEPFNGTREIVANSIVIIVFLQTGYAIRSRSMLSADFVIKLFPSWVQRIALALGYLFGAAFFALIIWGGWTLAIDSWVGGEFEGEGALQVPAWPTRFIILIGSALAIVNYLVVAYLDVVRPRDADGLSAEADPDFRPAPKL